MTVVFCTDRFGYQVSDIAKTPCRTISLKLSQQN